jgi:shikimate 5-dehydrogenase
VKILLANLSETADSAEAILSASFAFHGLVADIWQLNDISADELRQILVESPVEGMCLGGSLRREVAEMCDHLEGDARALGWVDSARSSHRGLIGDNTSVLALELGMSERRMWPSAASQVLVLGDSDWAQSAALGFSRVPALQVVFATEHAARRDETHIGWNDPAFHSRLADADLVVDTTNLAVADLPFTAGELPARCNIALTATGSRADEVVTATAAVHRNVMNGDEILLASMMLCFSRWTDIQPPPTTAGREAMK